ncbi:MAG: ubiquinone biosynthesis protein [Alphaproteobacteria bacterium]|nr:ubiquinone biosynthesis protein [Alphaproteobacteria bacterium]
MAKTKKTTRTKPAAHKTRGQAEVEADVLIIGGGLSGLTLAGVLGRAGVKTCVIDRDKPVTQLEQNFDRRATALSYATTRVLQAAGAWDAIAPHCAAVRDIRVADGASPLFLHFSVGEDGGLEDGAAAFGWNVENILLRRALFENTQKLKDAVTHLAPVTIKEFFRDDARAGVVLEDGRRISAPLMVGADGRGSAVRGWLGIPVSKSDYGQTAIVCTIAHEKDHEDVATEHFLPAGPFAVLPLPDDAQGRHCSSVIWSIHGKDAKGVLSLPREKFNAEMQRLCGPHLGRVECVSTPAGYPLALMHAQSYVAPRVALMAEAAHAIHPIAGQGLNLSMRDIAVLAEGIVDGLRLGLDVGAGESLENYEKIRRFDTHVMAGFTDILNKLFSNNLRSVALARDLGIGMVDKIAPLKGFFARQAMGLGGPAPRIVRDGRL